jgi:monoamine oxidase
MEAMAQGLDVRQGAEVTKIEHSTAGVRVSTADGKTVEGVAVVVATPLGVLKAGVPAFSPALPQWKADAISSLGFGNLNKVVLEFDSVFWDDSKDFFGAATSAQPAERGKHYSFWNMHGLMKTPVLTGIIAGEVRESSSPSSPVAEREREGERDGAWS